MNAAQFATAEIKMYFGVVAALRNAYAAKNEEDVEFYKAELEDIALCTTSPTLRDRCRRAVRCDISKAYGPTTSVMS